MPSIETLIAFVFATAIFAYIPGPSMLYATAQTLARGKRAGLMAALGIHIGGYVHVLAAAFGLAILFEMVPLLYIVLKMIGAAFLIFLGAHMILTRKRVFTSDPQPARIAGRAFWQSVVVEVLNPKTALFFVAFLPQFSDPSAAFPIWAQLFILGFLVNLMFSSADLICLALAHRMTRLIARSNRGPQHARALGGNVLIGLGLAVALER